MVICHTELLQQKLIDIGGNKYSFNKYWLRCYYMLGTGDTVTSNIDTILILMELIVCCSGSWDPLWKVWNVKNFFIILKHHLPFPLFTVLTLALMIKPMVGITAGILTQIEAGYQTVGIDIVITPIMHFLLKKNASFIYECPSWSSKNYWFD